MTLHEPDAPLAVALRRAAADLFDRRSLRDVETALSQVVTTAVALVPGAMGGGISRTEGDVVLSSHATDETVSRLDQEQSALREGPCVTAADDPPADGVVLVDDLAGDDGHRWPRFAPVAVRAGYRSILSTHLTSRPRGPRTALNLYAAEPGAFDEQSRITASLFAVQAATLLYGADEAQLLGRAMRSRDLIGQAKGVLMERFRIDDTEAFQMLSASSQETNIKLVDVAQWLIRETLQRPDRAPGA